MIKEDKKIDVLVVDNHTIIVEGILALLEEEQGIGKVQGVTCPKQALEVLAVQPFHVVLTDVNMPGISGVELTRRIKEFFPGIGVLALSISSESHCIVQMIKSGASGYIFKSSGFADLGHAIRIVAAGGNFLSAEVQDALMKNVYYNQTVADTINPQRVKLSSREKKILKLLAVKKTTEEIGHQLLLGEKTVEAYRKNIFTKTKTCSNVGLLKYAKTHGLISN